MDSKWYVKCQEMEKVAEWYDRTATMEDHTFHLAALPAIGGGYFLEVAEMNMEVAGPRVKEIVGKTSVRSVADLWSEDGAMAWFKRVMFDHCQKSKEA